MNSVRQIFANILNSRDELTLRPVILIIEWAEHWASSLLMGIGAFAGIADEFEQYLFSCYNKTPTMKQAALLFFALSFAMFPHLAHPQAASRIENGQNVYYPTLNEAFTAAARDETSGTSIDEPDEIAVLENITLTASILIDSPKHIRLVAAHGSRTIWRGADNLEAPLFRITGETASLTLGKPGMEHELIIDGGYQNNPPVQALSPLITVNGLHSKLIMYDNVIVQNNRNNSAAPDASLYQNGAGVFLRSLENRQEGQPEFIMKGGTIRGNVNNTRNAVACGAGVFIAGFARFTMEGGIIAGNTAWLCGGGFHTGSRGSFRKIGGVIYGYNDPEELQNKVIDGAGKPPFYGFAIAIPSVPPDNLWHGSDTTVDKETILTYTGAQRGQDVYFGKNENWGTQLYIPPKAAGPGLISILAAAGLLLALAATIVILKRKNIPVPAAVTASPPLGEVEIPDSLSPQEKVIFFHLMTDASRKQIAYNMKISPGAVNFHIHNIYRKLGIQSRIEFLTKYGKTPPDSPNLS